MELIERNRVIFQIAFTLLKFYILFSFFSCTQRRKFSAYLNIEETVIFIKEINYVKANRRISAETQEYIHERDNNRLLKSHICPYKNMN